MFSDFINNHWIYWIFKVTFNRKISENQKLLQKYNAKRKVRTKMNQFVVNLRPGT